MKAAIPDHLRRKRIWSVADFAEFTGLTHRRARRRLQRYNASMGGSLLIPTQGTNREYTFLPALLLKAINEGRVIEAEGLFDPVESLEMRLDHAEDLIGDLHQSQRAIALQTGQNTKDIAQLRRRTRAA